MVINEIQTSYVFEYLKNALGEEVTLDHPDIFWRINPPSCGSFAKNIIEILYKAGRSITKDELILELENLGYANPETTISQDWKLRRCSDRISQITGEKISIGKSTADGMYFLGENNLDLSLETVLTLSHTVFKSSHLLKQYKPVKPNLYQKYVFDAFARELVESICDKYGDKKVIILDIHNVYRLLPQKMAKDAKYKSFRKYGEYKQSRDMTYIQDAAMVDAINSPWYQRIGIMDQAHVFGIDIQKMRNTKPIEYKPVKKVTKAHKVKKDAELEFNRLLTSTKKKDVIKLAEILIRSRSAKYSTAILSTGEVSFNITTPRDKVNAKLVLSD